MGRGFNFYSQGLGDSYKLEEVANWSACKWFRSICEGDDRDFSCNMTTVTGYCVDIFDAVVEALPYAMTYQYIPFAKPDGKSAGTYINDLVYQVYLKVKLIFSHLFSIHRNTMLCTTILASYLYIMHHTLHRNRSMMAWSEIQLLLQTGLSMSILRCLTRKVVSQ
jgi:hypothetical protein